MAAGHRRIFAPARSKGFGLPGGGAGASASGNAVLGGGGGSDVFRFDVAPGAAHSDLLVDFSVTDDTIEIDHAMFAGLSVGALSAAAFAKGTSATNA